MPKRILSFFIVLSLLAVFCIKTITVHAVSYFELAEHWAPQVYQDVNTSFDVRADFITNFNYDGDYNPLNNWQNLSYYQEKGYVYYKVSETNTHYFIEYDLFHARDDAYTAPLDAHENDLEGLIIIVRKDGTTYGSFQLMETMAHNQWYQYTNDPNITSGSDGVDGGVLLNGSHAKVFCQANGQSPSGGHGVFAYDGSSAPGGDGIVYNYTGTAQFPTNATGDYTNSYGYALIEWGDLWSRRNDSTIFSSYGTFAGDDYTTNSAKAPWGWDDSDDGPSYVGMNFSDPAHQVDTHLNGLGSFSHDYVYNPYYSFKITVNTVTSNANRDTFGGKSDIYPKFVFGGEELPDMDRLWKYNDSAVGTARQVRWGYDSAVFYGQYSSVYNTLYFAHKPNNVEVKINIMDSDEDTDDDMGSIYAYPTPAQTITFTNAYTNSSQAIVTASVTAGGN